MNKMIVGAFSALLLAGGATGIALAGAAATTGDGLWARLTSGRDVPLITSESYATECGSCHFAYQPGLLPADGWARIMGALDDHFGDDATLDPAVAKDLGDYLAANAANDTRSIRSRAFAAYPLPADGLPRISKTVFFQRRHGEIPARLVKDNPQVKSFSQCDKCHRLAAKGHFYESSVIIPGGEG
ncbi:diheme cytochrome c [uncultured Thiodictyon sp.]|uniref:diheme cytochrome c n=1 Tax=uncultured Thiodictyon sp. TaxID=1846217 RepID=UPI0025D3AB25|nr:diheme cytochrome c [uncultured Thiodictyon sp.]